MLRFVWKLIFSCVIILIEVISMLFNDFVDSGTIVCTIFGLSWFNLTGWLLEAVEFPCSLNFKRKLSRDISLKFRIGKYADRDARLLNAWFGSFVTNGVLLIALGIIMYFFKIEKAVFTIAAIASIVYGLSVYMKWKVSSHEFSIVEKACLLVICTVLPVIVSAGLYTAEYPESCTSVPGILTKLTAVICTMVPSVIYINLCNKFQRKYPQLQAGKCTRESCDSLIVETLDGEVFDSGDGIFYPVINNSSSISLIFPEEMECCRIEKSEIKQILHNSRKLKM